MKHTRIKELLNSTEIGKQVTVKGWVKTFRNNQFLALNDGSTLGNIQAVVDFNHTDAAILKRLTTGAAVAVTGQLVASMGKGQRGETTAEQVEALGASDPDRQGAAQRN